MNQKQFGFLLRFHFSRSRWLVCLFGGNRTGEFETLAKSLPFDVGQYSVWANLHRRALALLSRKVVPPPSISTELRTPNYRRIITKVSRPWHRRAAAGCCWCCCVCPDEHVNSSIDPWNAFNAQQQRKRIKCRNKLVFGFVSTILHKFLRFAGCCKLHRVVSCRRVLLARTGWLVYKRTSQHIAITVVSCKSWQEWARKTRSN